MIHSLFLATEGYSRFLDALLSWQGSFVVSGREYVSVDKS